LDFGFWILDFGFWILDFGFWILDFGFWIKNKLKTSKRFSRFLKPYNPKSNIQNPIKRG